MPGRIVGNERVNCKIGLRLGLGLGCKGARPVAALSHVRPWAGYAASGALQQIGPLCQQV